MPPQRLFEDSVATLRDRLIELDPFLLLSGLSVFYLATTASANNEWTSRDTVMQHEVEFLQALTLMYSEESYGHRPLEPEDVRLFAGTLRKLHISFFLRRKERPGNEAQQSQRHSVIEGARIQTQALRNWAYPQQAERILAGVFEPMDDQVERELGVRPSALMRMWWALEAAAEERLNEHTSAVGKILSKATKRGVAEAFHEAFPQLVSSSDALLDRAARDGWRAEDLKSFALSQTNPLMPSIHTFDFQDFVRAYGQPVDVPALKDVLLNWSMSFGELRTHNIEHFFLGNPIWRKPFIRKNDHTFFWPIIGLAREFSWELLESLISARPQLIDLYHQRRAVYLQKEIEQVLSAAIPEARMLSGTKWSEDGVEYENDLLLILDSVALVVEAKSGRMPDAARRGADLTLTRELEELVVDPARQALRFVDFLKAHRRKLALQTATGEQELDASALRIVSPLTVTLDLVGLTARVSSLKRAGLFPPDLGEVPNMSLGDLLSVTEVLETPLERLHYLVRRFDIEKRIQYLGDEQDLIVFYLKSGFALFDFEEENAGFWILGLSQQLDAFFMAPYYWKKPKRPRRKYTRWWKECLQSLDRRRPELWAQISLHCLDLGYGDQVAVERALKETVSRASVSRRPAAAALELGPKDRRIQILAVAHMSNDEPEIHRFVAEAAVHTAPSEAPHIILVVGRSITGKTSPYSILGFIEP